MHKFITVVSMGVLLAGCSSASGLKEEREEADQVPAYETRLSSEAGVEVEVTPLSIGSGSWTFEVGLSTHSVDLAEDLMKVSVLRTDAGKELSPVSWDGSPPGGHHREGVLTFENPGDGVEGVALEIREVGGVEVRSFEWDL